MRSSTNVLALLGMAAALPPKGDGVPMASGPSTEHPTIDRPNRAVRFMDHQTRRLHGRRHSFDDTRRERKAQSGPVAVERIAKADAKRKRKADRRAATSEGRR